MEYIYYLKKNKLQLFALFIAMIIIHLYYFCGIISIDTECFINNQNELINSWIAIGRWGLALLKYIFLYFPFNILIIRIITFLIFYISITVYVYLFSNWINIKNKSLIFIIGFLIGSSPIFAEQFGFTLQSLEISFGLFIMALDFVLIDKYFKDNNKTFIVLSMIATLFCLSLYQAFNQLFIGISLFYIICHFDKSLLKKKIKIFIIIFIVSFFIYYIANLIFKNYIYKVDSNYLTSTFAWKDKSIISNILRIGYFSAIALLGLDYYHSISYFIYFLLSVIFIVKNKEKKDLFIFLLLSIVPFLLIVVTASNTAYRAQFSYVFVLLFMFLYLYKNTNKKKIIMFLILLTILKQSFITSTLLYSDYKRFQKDVELSNYIKEIVNNSDNHIIFVGKYNNGIKIKGETLGNSFAEWDYDTEFGVNARIYGFLKTQNIEYKIATIEQYKKYKELEYSSENIVYDGEYIIINLNRR